VFYDKSQIIIENGGDQVIDLLGVDWWNRAKFNSDFGIEYTWGHAAFGNVLFGFVSKNFIPQRTFSNDLDIFPNTNYVYGRYHSNRRDNYFPHSSLGSFDFSFAAVGIHTGGLHEKADFIQGIFNANAHWNHDDYIFTAGFLYSSKTDLGVVLGIDWVYNFSASFIYMYNWTLRKDILNPMGSFELVLTYKLKPKGANKPCKDRGAICLPERKIPKSPY
jgi:hypothetical protein